MDLFVVPTIGFKLLYAFVIVRLNRRDLVWINVTTNPSAEWIARQITEALPWNGAPRYMIRDVIGSVVPSSHADCVPRASGTSGHPADCPCRLSAKGLNRSRGRAPRRAAWPCQQWMEMGACCLTMKGQKHIPRTDDRSAR
jgi:hypothetical protein